MKEIQDQIQEMLEKLSRMEERLDSMHEKTKTLLEAITKTAPQPKENKQKGVGGLKWINQNYINNQHI